MPLYSLVQGSWNFQLWQIGVLWIKKKKKELEHMPQCVERCRLLRHKTDWFLILRKCWGSYVFPLLRILVYKQSTGKGTFIGVLSTLKLTWVSKGKYNLKKFITTILSRKITSTKALRIETKVSSDFCTIVTDPETKENSLKLVSFILNLSQMYSRGCEKDKHSQPRLLST